jgi:hypothetical protein
MMEAWIAENFPNGLPGEEKPKGGASASSQASGNGGFPFLFVPDWLRDRGIEYRVKPQPDGRGRTVYVLKKCPFDAGHGDPDSCIMQEPGGKLSAQCFHDSCQGRGWEAFRDAIGKPEPHHYDPASKNKGAGRATVNEKQEPSADDSPKAPSASTKLVKIALSAGAELTHAPDGQGHLTVTRERRRETWPIRSRAVRGWLRLMYYNAFGCSAGSQAVESALGVLEGMALCAGEERAVHVRIADAGERIYLDLADAERRIVEIDRSGWRIVGNPPVLFRRPRGLLALPVPIGDGDVEDLQRVLNLESERDWFLLIAWTLAAMRPHGPYPVLCLHGEQGAAKSTTARALRSLIDPSVACLRSEPRDGRDVMIAATNGWVVALDNLSSIQPWLSDCLCRLATGGGYATRELYSDTEETILDAQRPVILTSIEDLATRGDLLDRAIVLTLPAIPEDRCRPEKELWAEYEQIRPRLLGALLDALAGILDRLPAMRLDRLPRMADFALLGVATEKALGWPKGAFLHAYADNRQSAHTIALESSPIVPPLVELANAVEEWTGIASELLDELVRRAGDKVTKRRDWPAKPRGLTGILRRLLPALRSIGVSITFGARRGKGVPISVRGVRGVRDSQPCSHDTPFDADADET